MGFNGFEWVFIIFLWVSMDFYGFLWVFKDFIGFLIKNFFEEFLLIRLFIYFLIVNKAGTDNFFCIDV
jgi:hypothetical protein